MLKLETLKGKGKIVCELAKFGVEKHIISLELNKIL